jgi:hypothetical protein
MFIQPQELKVLPTLDDVKALYGGILRDLRERGYSHSTWSEMHVKPFDETRALISGVFVRHKTDGTELETRSGTYILRKVDGEWKIAVIIGHPPRGVLRTE